MKNKPSFSSRILIVFGICLMGSGLSYSQGTADFWGNGMYKGRAVISSDVITAFDPQGILCGTATGGQISGGVYGITVQGDDPLTPAVDEGAINGDHIRFKINGDWANITGGSDVWIYPNTATRCDFAVPDVPPVANPGGPYSGNEGSPVSFNGSGSTGAVTYSWTFGDGQSGSGVTPTHTYVQQSNYTVTLTVYNNSGQSNTKTTTANIANVVPTVSASSDAPQNEGSPVHFTGSATDPGTADVLTYSWNFGDGSNSTQQNPTHTYVDDAAGSNPYTATLTVNDGTGNGSKQISVMVNNVAPTAEAGSNQTVNEGQTVSFNGNATDPGTIDVPTLQYSWNYGDGQTGNGVHVTHVFTSNGPHTVTLTVTDKDGGAGTDNLTVTVNNLPPTANAGGSYFGVVNYPVQFHGTGTDPGGVNDVLTYTWDLDNDGQYDDFTGQNPTKTYTSTGNFTVALKVTDEDGASATNTAAIEVGIGVPITFATSPAGMPVKVDGDLITTPKTYYYVNGSTHAVETAFIQNEQAGVRYVYNGWSDGGLISHSITVGTAPVTYTANYKKQYLLRVDDGGNNGHPVGSGYYDPNTVVQISVDSAVVDQAGTSRFRFSRWQGSGEGQYSGTLRNATVTMKEPITQTAVWGAGEYYVKVESPYGSVLGAGWFMAGATTTVSVDTAISTGPGRRQTFMKWNGQGSGSYTGVLNPATVQVNAPLVQTAEWKVEYFVDVQSDYGNPSGEGWYREGGTAVIRCDTAIVVDTGKRVKFASWFGNGSGSYTGALQQKTLTVNGPITETVQWKIQYALVLVTDYGNPKPNPEGWYDEGTRVSFSVDTLIGVSEDTRYRFKGWLGVGAGSYTGSQNKAEVVVTNPMTEEAEWNEEYYLAITVQPAGSGTVSPFPPGGGWGVASDTLELRAIGKVEDAYGFSSWSGDANGNANPLPLILNGPKHITAHFKQGSVFISTDPPGLILTVDGREVVAPVVYDWLSGERHRIGTIAFQGDSVSARYSFLDWSDGGAMDHDITVTASTVRYTARFEQSYFLKVQSEHGTAAGQGWYAKGATATVRIDTVANATADSRHRFAGWNGTGPGSVTSASPVLQFAVMGPVTETAVWEPQVRVQVSVAPPGVPGGSVRVSPPLAWYPLGTQLTLTAIAGDTGHPFVRWSGNWSGNAVSTDNPLVLLVSKPLVIRAWFWVQDEPPRISEIPDLTLKEDEILKYSFDWLRLFVSDPNDAVETLDVQFNGPKHVAFLVDFQRQEITIKPEPHWNGAEQAVVTVTDPYGLSDADTFNVRVLSIEDPPGRFALIAPADDTTLFRWDAPIEFRWHKAADPDEGEAVQYSLILSGSALLKGSEDMRTVFMSDTMILLAPPKEGTYYWGVIARDSKGNTASCDKIFRIMNLTAVEADRNIPLTYGLDQNYPNPFNPETTVPFQTARPGTVRIQIFDLDGRIVRVLEDRHFDAGSHKARWDGLDDNGRQTASGVYVIRIQAGDFAKQRKMLLMR
jgi:PKD repeat protein